MRSDDFASVFEAIRAARGYRSQKAFAAHAEISQSALSELVTGTRELTREMHARLVAKFPEFRQRLDAVLEAHERPELDQQRTVLAKIEQLLQRGRRREATGALERLLNTPYLSASVGSPAHVHLGTLAFDEGDVDTGIAHFLDARALLRDDGQNGEADRVFEVLALRLTGGERYEQAEELALKLLEQDPLDTLLWRRLGVIRWYAGRPLDSYAALTTALWLGHRRQHIIHARGQVLVDLGLADLAIAELTEAISGAKTPLSIAYARSSRARAYALHDEHVLAFKEFALAEQETPDNAWLFYFRARSYDDIGRIDEAVADYETALEKTAPPLTRSKREFTLDRLSVLTRNPT